MYERRIREKRLDELQLLKGIAILMVVLVHSNLGLGRMNPVLEQLISVGRWGCQLFFVISGFQLMMSWEKKKQSIGSFYFKRFVRIAPSYYLAILFYGVLNFLVTALYSEEYCFTINSDIKSLLLNILLLHSLDPASFNYVVPGGWYIGTQWTFYLLFPVVAYLYDKVLDKYRFKKAIWTIPIAFFVFSLVIQVVIARFYGSAGLSALGTCLFYSPLNQLPCFLIGISLYYEIKNGILERISERITIAVCLCLGFVASVMFYFLRNVPFIYTAIPAIYSCAFAFLILFTLKIYDKYAGMRIVRSISRWGDVSFGAYYVNAFTVIFIPWLFLKISGLNDMNQTFLYVVLLIPMFIITYYLGMWVNQMIDLISVKLEVHAGIRQKK